jgi:3-methyladenine DNA glycosylase AlkD
MIERFPLLFDSIFNWANDERVYVRRASAVCLIKSTAMSFKVEVPFEYVKNICDILKYDKHLHIQKGIGWLLKYAYLTYPLEVEEYLQNNIKNLSRTSYRYALEKMSKEKRELFMQL